MTEETIKQAETEEVQAEGRNRAVSVFLARDAISGGNLSGFLGAGVASDETKKKLAKVREAGRDEGIELHLLCRQPGGFSLLFVWVKPNYPLPIHSHDDDCMYYIATGSLLFGSKTLRAGDGFFVPHDCPYRYTGGPEGAEVLEIRHGVDVVNTVVPSFSDKRVEMELELVKANAEQWREMRVSPTFAANGAND